MREEREGRIEQREGESERRERGIKERGVERQIHNKIIIMTLFGEYNTVTMDIHV